MEYRKDIENVCGMSERDTHKADHKNPMRMKLHSTHPYCKYEYEVGHEYAFALHVVYKDRMTR